MSILIPPKKNRITLNQIWITTLSTIQISLRVCSWPKVAQATLRPRAITLKQRLPLQWQLDHRRYRFLESRFKAIILFKIQISYLPNNTSTWIKWSRNSKTWFWQSSPQLSYINRTFNSRNGLKTTGRKVTWPSTTSLSSKFNKRLTKTTGACSNRHNNKLTEPIKNYKISTRRTIL